MRFHITMKTSTEETTRLLAAVLQQQLREVGIALDIRTLRVRNVPGRRDQGRFPDLLVCAGSAATRTLTCSRYVFATTSFAPKRANRDFYSNPRVDELIEEGRSTLDQAKRKAIYDEIQQILAEDLPYINLWYLDNVLVHTNRVQGSTLIPRETTTS